MIIGQKRCLGQNMVVGYYGLKDVEWNFDKDKICTQDGMRL